MRSRSSGSSGSKLARHWTVEEWLTQMMPLARTMARRYARTTADIDDMIQHGLMCLDKAIRQSNKLGQGPVRTDCIEKPWALGKTVLFHAMTRYNSRRSRHGRGDAEVLMADIAQDRLPQCSSAIPGERSDPEGALLDGLYLEQYLTALEAALGLAARRIASQLVTPDDPELCRSLLSQPARRSSAGHASAVRHIRISPRRVRAGLKVKRRDWREEMVKIREFTRRWISRAHDDVEAISDTVLAQPLKRIAG